jgi:uncharacterized protein Usg
MTHRTAKEAIVIRPDNHSDVAKLFGGQRLITAHILYRMPDHRHLLQEFIWQNLDKLPELPQLNKFLRFWKHAIDGPLHEVRVACAGLILPSDLKYYRLDHEITLQ